MKLLITILLLLNLKVVVAMTHTEIDDLTVNKALTQLMYRLGFAGPNEYSIEPKSSESDPRSRYDRLVMVEPNVKPTFPALQAELIIYKADLHIIEDARIAENARIADLRNRKNALNHPKLSMMKHLNIQYSPAAWFRDNKSSMDHAEMEAHMVAIEAEDVLQTNLANTQATKETNRQAARNFIKNYDCSTITNNLNKSICIVLQR